MNDNGQSMHDFCADLFPICRSLTGDGVRETLKYIQDIIPELLLSEVPSGTAAFDWSVPPEWNINDAYIADESGKRIVDFSENNLHVVGYSEPIDTEMSFRELDKHLYSLPNQPDAIPYITSYYSKRWGFCLTETLYQKLSQCPDAKYKVKIDSSLKPGHMTYGELVLPGETEQEILLSTYICHPSMANNELSGPAVAVSLVQWLKSLRSRRYTYRIVFVPETIGSIVYVSKHLEHLKEKTVAGFVLTCLGDDRAYSYLPSRLGGTLADRAAVHTLNHHVKEYRTYTFLDRGSDERQYCSPGVDLPVCSVMRTKYGEYPEYHTSLDDLSLVSPSGLEGGYSVLRKIIELLEINRKYRTNILCEPQLGKRGLYPNLSTKGTDREVRTMINLIAYADGQLDLIAIAEKIGVNAADLLPLIEKLLKADVLTLKK